MSPYEKASEKLLNCLTTAVSLSFSYCIVLFINCKPAPAWSLMIPVHMQDSFHGLINYIDSKAKCRHLKQFIMLIFSTQLCGCCPSPLLSVQLPPPPVWISILYRRIQCVREGYGVLRLRQIHPCRKVPLQVIFLDDDIWHCLLWVLPFYDSFKAGPVTGCSSFINCLSWLWLKTLLCTDIAAARPCSCRKREYHENLDPPVLYSWLFLKLFLCPIKLEKAKITFFL